MRAALGGRPVLAVVLCVAALPASAAAAPGDIYVADQALASPTGAILRVDPATGAPTILASGPPLSDPADVALSPNGDLLVADPGAEAIFRIDVATGAISVAVSGGKLARPSAVVATRANRAYVADPGAPGAPGTVFRVNPVSGAKTQISSGSLVDPLRLALDRDASLLLTDAASVIRVDPASGALTQFASGPPLTDLRGVAVAASGSAFVIDRTPPATLYEIGRPGSPPTPLAAGAPFASPDDVAVDSGGSLLVADPGAGPTGALIRVDPATGARTVLASGPPFADPAGVAVSPPTCRGRPATIVGSPGDDRLVGSTSAGTPDVVAALGGNDRIKANNGSDYVCGGDGNDRVNGGKGKDSISGNAGADRLGGSAGKDSLDGGSGRDVCDGGSGTDAAKHCERPKHVP